ncbi:hypothetical protein [Roseovarius indicus]|uniref:2-keto-4-pentenoate hydratase n=1 Tax=Roseovarius indicus TaxID=540747 RepID=A0A0T5P5U4_9RHOB|nr:hypothetical protein [Roseovarius indicus]KRS16555.1 hypothetical protein XM52_18400 [Roseovarius indicus]QEW28209.1 2-keto-4-pentenoate hydratase [Roseovarius indicus]SFE56415.1 2-keto-4-pentenoate hydratase [Roseovarius indicus]
MTYIRNRITPTERFSIDHADIPTDISTAYDGLLEIVRNDCKVWKGWKLGGSNHGTQAAFNVSKPYFGPLHETEIMSSPKIAPGLSLCQLQGEVEISLRISADGEGYDAWCVSLEMPASALKNLPAAGVEALVADRCGAGALVLGPTQDGPLPDMYGKLFSLWREGECLSEAGLDSLIASPGAILSEFLGLARGLGFSPAPGDWVATGGITSCCPFSDGDKISVLMSDQLVLAFVAQRGSQ